MIYTHVLNRGSQGVQSPAAVLGLKPGSASGATLSPLYP